MSGARMATARPVEPPPAGEIRPFDAPRVERRQLGNGAGVLVATRAAFPLVTVRVVVDAGASAEPDGRAGLAHLTANALDAGAAGRAAGALADAFEQLGAELESVASWDAASVQVSVAAGQLDPALALLADVVGQPSFPAPEVERLRGKQIAEIMQRRAEPRALANDTAARFIYAPSSTYARSLLGRPSQVETLDAVAVAAFHRQRFVPGSAAIVLAGAIDADTAAELAERHFGRWHGARAAPPPVRLDAGTERTTIYIVDRPGSVQSEIRIGHVGVPRSHADYFALEVMNSLLGGAFTSRLNMNLRERHGFTYGVRSGFAYRRFAGPFVIDTAVATEVTARAVQEVLGELRTLLDSGPRDDEVAAARDYIAGIVPLQLQTTEQVAAKIAELFVHDLPDDYLLHFLDGIRAVTLDDVTRVARAHLHPDRLAIVIVGDAASITAPLQTLGAGPVEPAPATP